VTSLVAFVGIAAVVIVTPGPDTALTIRNSLAGGRRAGVLTALGVSTGQACWTAAASAGVAALLVASEPVFRALRLVGAAYLVWLGAQALWSAWSGVRRHERPGPRRTAPFRQGLLSNLANPKMAVFFTSLLPQFGSASFGALLGLGLLFCTMTLAWLAAYAFAVARAGDVLRRSNVRRAVDAVTGTVLVAFGARLAAERP
jgi:threonine/homoserine/homoserine lactone efflux protein